MITTINSQYGSRLNEKFKHKKKLVNFVNVAKL